MSISDKIETWLIAEWRQAWKYWSVKLNGAGISLLALTEMLSHVWGTMPPDLRASLPYAQHAAIALFVGGFLARFIAQPKVPK